MKRTTPQTITATMTSADRRLKREVVIRPKGNAANAPFVASPSRACRKRPVVTVATLPGLHTLDDQVRASTAMPMPRLQPSLRLVRLRDRQLARNGVLDSIETRQATIVDDETGRAG
jgi:hypothetical protein